MATKKFLTLERLTEYDELIKGEISDGDASTLAAAKSYTNTEVAKKANSSHTHDDRYYTETEIDSKISTINTSITNITSGTTVVKEAEHAESADEATHATSADSATNASTLGATDADTGSTTQPIYLDNGVAKAGSTYAGGTKVTLNGSAKGGSTASFYAPTAVGTAGYILTSTGSTTKVPTWTQTLPVANGGTGATDAAGARTNLGVYSTTEVDTKLSGKSDTSHKHDDLYDAKNSAATAEANANAYTDGKISALLDGASDTTLDSIKELADAIKTNDSAIDALNEVAAGKQTTITGAATTITSNNLTANRALISNGSGKVAISAVTSTELGYLDGVTSAIQTQLDGKVPTSRTINSKALTGNISLTYSDVGAAPSSHTHDVYVNQNAFSNIKVGETTIAADTTTDTLELVGTNVTITPDETNDKVTIAVASGSTSTAGILKLTNSTSSTSTTTAATPSSVKSAYDLANTAKTNAATAQTKADSAYSLAEGKVGSLSDLGITATATELNYMDGVTSNVQTQLDGKAASGHTHDAATTSVAGFMTAAMVTKLNGIATGATKVTVDSALSSSSTNPVQNKVVNSAITTATNAITANTSSITTHTSQISALQTAVGEIQEISSAEIQALFA